MFFRVQRKKRSSTLRSASVLAKQAPLALSNVAGYGEASEKTTIAPKKNAKTAFFTTICYIT